MDALMAANCALKAVRLYGFIVVLVSSQVFWQLVMQSKHVLLYCKLPLWQ